MVAEFQQWHMIVKINVNIGLDSQIFLTLFFMMKSHYSFQKRTFFQVLLWASQFWKHYPIILWNSCTKKPISWIISLFLGNSLCLWSSWTICSYSQPVTFFFSSETPETVQTAFVITHPSYPLAKYLLSSLPWNCNRPVHGITYCICSQCFTVCMLWVLCQLPDVHGYSVV